MDTKANYVCHLFNNDLFHLEFISCKKENYQEEKIIILHVFHSNVVNVPEKIHQTIKRLNSFKYAFCYEYVRPKHCVG